VGVGRRQTVDGSRRWGTQARLHPGTGERVLLPWIPLADGLATKGRGFAQGCAISGLENTNLTFTARNSRKTAIFGPDFDGTSYAVPILPLKWPIHIAFSHNSATDKDRRIQFGSKYALMDFNTNLTFKVQKDYKTTPKWAWPGSRDLISKFWDRLNNFWTNWAIRFKFGRETDPYYVRTIKRPISRRSLGKVTQFQNFRTSIITFERIELSA